MIYKFWETCCNHCIIEKGDSGRVYVTPMMDWYKSESGRKALLPYTTTWGTDALEDYEVTSRTYLGELEVSTANMADEDKEVLQRCISKEGFDYAMLHYSDYKSVGHNKVEDEMFLELFSTFRTAYKDLELYLKMQGIDTEKEEL